VKRLLLAAARAPVTRRGRLLLGVLAGCAFFTEGVTDGRSIGALLLVVGLIFTIHTWAWITDWDGIWSRFVTGERRRIERVPALALARTRPGRLIVELNRKDHPLNRGRAVIGLVVAPIFVVVGVLALVGAVELS